jgi:hypothetical protein
MIRIAWAMQLMVMAMPYHSYRDRFITLTGW